MPTYNEMFQLHEKIADKVLETVSLNQRIFFKEKELKILLMWAASKGYTAGCDFCAKAMGPEQEAAYNRLKLRAIT